MEARESLGARKGSVLKMWMGGCADGRVRVFLCPRGWGGKVAFVPSGHQETGSGLV